MKNDGLKDRQTGAEARPKTPIPHNLLVTANEVIE
jgi:hypothetical protein